MRRRYAILPAGLVAAALLATAPAALLERLVPGSLPLRLASCSGTVWSGGCVLLLSSDRGWLSAGRIDYSWRLAADGGLQMELRQNDRPAGRIRPSWAGWKISGLQFESAISFATALAPGGRQLIMAQSLDCDWRLDRCAGKARIEARDLALTTLAPEPMGSYALDLEIAPEGQIVGRLTTIAGAVTLLGELHRPAGGRVRLSGRASLAPGTAEGLRRALARLARPEGQDSFAFDYTV